MVLQESQADANSSAKYVDSSLIATKYYFDVLSVDC